MRPIGLLVLRHRFFAVGTSQGKLPTVASNRSIPALVPTGFDMPTSTPIAAMKHRRRHSERPLQLASSPLVLLVEHELASRVSSANELLDEGYDIVESESASEAMNILRGRSDFDAMIGDIDAEHAPGGLALVRYAANHHPSMKILVRSAWPDSQAESGEVDTDFLPKPYPAGDLVRRMHGLLGYQLTPVRE